MTMRTAPGKWWVPLVAGIASIVLGLLLIVSPGMSLLVLVTFLGFYWLIRGIFSIAEIFSPDREVGWGWLLTLGLLGVFAGLIVLRHPLYAAAFLPTVLAIVIGIDAILIGLINIYRAFTGSGGWAAVLGILDIIVGGVLLASPVLAGLSLPIALGVLFIIGGIALIWLSFSTRGAMRREERMMKAA